MKRIFTLFLAVCVTFCVFQSCTKNNSSKMYTIGLVQLIDAPILDTARIGVLQGLASKGFIDGKNIKIDYINAQGELSNVPLIFKKFTTDKVDLIITITTPCMVAAAQLVKDIPVVFTIAFSPEQMKIKETPKNMTGVSDPMDMSGFIKLVKAIMPNIKTLGLPYNSAEANSVFASDKLEAECVKNNIQLLKMNLNGPGDIPQAAEALVLKKIDAFAVSADNTLNAGIASLVRIAEKHKIPVFATATDNVKSGAVAGIGSDYRKWGESGGLIAASIINGSKPAQIPIKVVDSYTTEINLKAAALQGVKIPDEVLKTADKVLK